MYYLVNPGKRAGKKKSKGRKRPRTAAQRAATKKMLAARKRKSRKSTKRFHSKGVKKMAKRKRSSTKRRRSHRRGKALRFTPVGGKVYRRNPGGMVKGVLGNVMQGVKDGASVLAGEAVAGVVASKLPVSAVAGKGAVALGLAVLAPRFIPKDVARMLVAGAVASALREPAKGLPVIGPALAGDEFIGEYLDPGVGEINEQGEFIGEYAY